MLALTRRLLRNSTGATAVEYGLILALLVVAVIASMSMVASTTTDMWNLVATTVSRT